MIYPRLINILLKIILLFIVILLILPSVVNYSDGEVKNIKIETVYITQNYVSVLSSFIITITNIFVNKKYRALVNIINMTMIITLFYLNIYNTVLNIAHFTILPKKILISLIFIICIFFLDLAYILLSNNVDKYFKNRYD